MEVRRHDMVCRLLVYLHVSLQITASGRQIDLRDLALRALENYFAIIVSSMPTFAAFFKAHVAESQVFHSLASRLTGFSSGPSKGSFKNSSGNGSKRFGSSTNIGLKPYSTHTHHSDSLSHLRGQQYVQIQGSPIMDHSAVTARDKHEHMMLESVDVEQ